MEAKGSGGHVEVALNAGGEALMVPVVYDRGWRSGGTGWRRLWKRWGN